MNEMHTVTHGSATPVLLPPLAERATESGEPSRLAAAELPNAPAPAAGGRYSLARRVALTVRTWRDRARGRAELRRLGARMLTDIGLSRVDAWQEARKPFWRP